MTIIARIVQAALRRFRRPKWTTPPGWIDTGDTLIIPASHTHIASGFDENTLRDGIRGVAIQERGVDFGA